jgi:cysteine desulfuration protein SufE
VKREEHRLHGCQSMVWIVGEGDRDAPGFPRDQRFGHRVGPGVPGVARVLGPLGGRNPCDRTRLRADIGLSKHLSPTRSNGHAALLAFIRERAQAAL